MATTTNDEKRIRRMLDACAAAVRDVERGILSREAAEEALNALGWEIDDFGTPADEAELTGLWKRMEDA